jgi:hypothetical protein
MFKFDGVFFCDHDGAEAFVRAKLEDVIDIFRRVPVVIHESDMFGCLDTQVL